ncbi:DMT family transporter [Thermocatellispora tengchongensis]|uniref:DMT family transporter n=1 Tax=Thermocatellispora tengchongensis TaxID=1073253 RepID=UPI001616BA2E|nr:EamA family transporter [Thermocatellispora tengchongensis]
MRIHGAGAVLGAAALWGTAGAAGVIAFGGGGAVDSVALAAARLVVGGVVLALGVGLGRVAGVVRGMPPGDRWLMGAAAVAVAVYQLAFFAAVSRTGVAIGTVVAIGSGPVFTGVLAWGFERVRPSRRWGVATAAAVLGCALLILGGEAAVAGSGQVAEGVALALVGGLIYAFYAVCAARMIGRGAASDGVMGGMFGGAALIMLPVLLVGDVGWLGTPAGLGVALYLGCATTALAYFLYGRGLRTTPVATAATLALAEPAVAAVLGVVVLGERLGGVSVGGLVLLGAALVVAALPEAGARRRVGAAESSV